MWAPNPQAFRTGMGSRATHSLSFDSQGVLLATASGDRISAYRVPDDADSNADDDDDDIADAFESVTVDGLVATEDAVLRYLEQRFDSMGDRTRFPRMVARFTASGSRSGSHPRRVPGGANTITAAQFSLILLKIAQS